MTIKINPKNWLTRDRCLFVWISLNWEYLVEEISRRSKIQIKLHYLVIYFLMNLVAKPRKTKWLEVENGICELIQQSVSNVLTLKKKISNVLVTVYDLSCIYMITIYLLKRVWTRHITIVREAQRCVCMNFNQ